MSSLRRKGGCSAIFVLLAIAATSIVTSDVPTGPWEGMYASYPTVWISVILALVGLLYLVRVEDIGWPVVIGVTVISVLLITELSRQWGVPYGLRDPWVHLDLMKTQTYWFQNNPYPAFHILLNTIVFITSLDAITVLGASPVLAAGVGVGFLALVVRGLDLHRKTQQTAVIVASPIVIIGSIARPYTLAIPFILVFIWIASNGVQDRRSQVLIIVFTLGALWLHLVPFTVGGFILSAAILIGLFFGRFSIPYVQLPPQSAWMRVSFPILIGFVLVGQLFLFTPVGGTIVDEAISGMSAASGGGPETPPGDITTVPTDEQTMRSPSKSPPTTGQVTESTKPPRTIDNTSSSSSGPPSSENKPLFYQISQNFPEFLKRTAVVWLMGLGVAALVFTELRRRKIDYLSLTIGLASLMVLVLALVIDILQIPVFSARRILSFAPIVLFPLFARTLEKVPWTAVLAVLVLLAGLATVYDSPAFTGGIEAGETESQPIGYRWLYTYYGNGSVIGSGSTYWVAQGLFGIEVSGKWGGKEAYRQRLEQFAWQVRDPNGSVYAVSASDRALAVHLTREDGYKTRLDDLGRFQTMANQFYDNGNLRFYNRARTTPTTPKNNSDNAERYCRIPGTASDLTP